MKVGSLFSGIGGFDLAFERAGAEIIWQVEIDKQCQGVLQRHWPGVPLYGDIRDLDPATLPVPDILVGGFPCQGLSAAGLRRGLADERSGLWYEFHRLIHGLGVRGVCIENVPGLLSNDGGRDFAIVLAGLTGVVPSIPEGGWRNSGFARGIYNVAWRVLDAQYFGLAQRRRRVFIIGCLAPASPLEVLFESEGVCWDPPTRRKAGQRIAATTARGVGAGSGREDRSLMEGTVGSLQSHHPRYDADSAGAGHIIPILEAGARQGEKADARDGTGIGEPGDPMFTLQASKQHGIFVTAHTTGNGWWNEGPISGTERPRDCKDQNTIVAGDIAHTLSAEGADASEDGTGRGTPLVLALSENQRGELVLTETAHQLTTGGGKPGQGYAAIAFAPNPTTSGEDRSNPQSGEPLVFDTAQITSGVNRTRVEPGLPSSTLASGSSMHAAGDFGVRRLTPIECLRLQGFPDSWCEGNSDAAIYRMAGNAVAVPVVEWIARRMMQ